MKFLTKPLVFEKARFITSAVKPKDYPFIRALHGFPTPEIAIVGRSNVGKSSLINHLFQTKTLAKTSSTPGKTQTINFFMADEQAFFVDLPGYGFASVPVEVRKQWGPMIETYLKEREGIRLILLLLDIRRQPNEDDLKLIEWLKFYQKPTAIVLTKVDKVNQSDKHHFTKRILQELGDPTLPIVHYSVIKTTSKLEGRNQLIQLINSYL